MAKAKLDLSGAGMKKLALEHCEKLVFGICALLLLLLAYWGYQRPVFDDKKDNPNNLIASSKRSQDRINATKWETPNSESTNFKMHRIADLSVPTKVEEINLQMVNGSQFPNYAPGEISLSTKPKRMNPEILAATDVRAQFSFQMIALKPGIGGGSSRIMDAMYAPEPKKAEPKKRKKKKKQTPNFGSGRFGMEDDEEKGDDMQSPGSGGMGAPSSGGGNGGGGKSRIKKPDGPVHVVPEVQKGEMEGVPVDGMITSTFDRNDKEIMPSVMWRQVVCVTAVVPFKKQVEAFEKALKGTRRYEPSSDIPKYIGLKIQRRVNGGTWHDISSKVKGADEAINALSYPSLIQDQEYDPFLNAPIPAFLLNDFDQFVMHPKSKMRDFLASEEDEEAVDTSDDSTTNETKNFDEFDASSNKTMEDDAGELEEELTYVTSENAAETKQIRFFDYLVGYTDENKKKVEIQPNDKIEYKVNVILSHPNLPLSFVTGEEGTGRRKGGSSARSGAGSSGNSAAERGKGLMSGGGGGSGSAMPGGGAGSMMPGSSGGSGASSGSGYMGGGGGKRGGSGGGGAAVSRSAELTADMLGNPFISDTDLDGSIRPEILAFKDEDPVELPGGNVVEIVNKYGLTSPESPVSNAVVFTMPTEKYAAGSAMPLNLRNAKGVNFYDAEPEAELVLFEHSDAFQMKIPGKAKVFAGTPMVFDAKAEVFNPLDWTIRWVGPKVTVEEDDEEVEKRGNYEFSSPAIVLDVFQSTTLENQGDFKTEFHSPAEILVFDGVGNFRLQNELDDITEFRHATFAEGEEVESTGAATGGSKGNRDGLQGSGGASPGGSSGFPGFGN